MNTLPMRDEHITLAQALKLARVADSGGQAKNLVRSGLVTVNGAPEMQPGRKLYPGDRFRVHEGDEWVLVR
jgi:ribosome-associated protein